MGKSEELERERAEKVTTGAFGEGTAPGTSAGTGPRVDTRTDNGAIDSEGHLIPKPQSLSP